MYLKNITLSFIILLITFGCSGDSNHEGSNLCGDLSNFGLYDTQSIKLLVTTDNGPYQDKGYSPGTRVTSENIFINILVNERVFTNNSAKNSIGFSLFRSAFACSPSPPYTDEIISDINIVSDVDYSSEYLAGSNMSKLFEVYDSDSNEISTFPVSLDEFISTSYRSTPFLGLKLKTNPELGKEHIFTIQYKHEGGEEFTITSPIISFE